MKTTLNNIKVVENQWLNKLYQFSEKSFSNVKIPSHDHSHHLRVWNLAKELIEDLSEIDHEFEKSEIEEIIVATLLHDIGMIITVDSKHGHESRLIAEQFLKENPLQFGADKLAILQAIELHDDKEYKNMVYGGEMQKHILSILCVCDDLDAFGAVGIFRYLEIYLLRGKTVEQITEIVLKNIKSRFNNFEKLYGHLQHVHQHQLERFGIINNFFNDLKNGHAGAKEVTDILINEIVNGSQTAETIGNFTNQIPTLTNYTKTFFIQFSSELS